jgi:hypothetical protein
MDNLRALRDRDETQYQVETQLLQAMSVNESLQTWAKLQRAFEWQLQQTASLFEQAHRDSLAELQERLHKLIE